MTQVKSLNPSIGVIIIGSACICSTSMETKSVICAVSILSRKVFQVHEYRQL